MMESKTQKFDRIRREHHAKRMRVGNPLNVIQLACLFLLQCESLARVHGQRPRAVEIRRFVYQQRFGDLTDFHRGWYCDYFRVKGHFTTQSIYVDRYWQVYTDDGKVRTWCLTALGRKIALDAKKTLARRSRCKIDSGA